MKTKNNKLIYFILVLSLITVGFGNRIYALSAPSDANFTAPFPTITSTYLTSIDSTSVILNGSVNPNGLDTNAWFHFGAPLNPPLQLQNIGNGKSPVSLNSYTLIGLTPGNSYSFRIEASNDNGVAYGSWTAFTTSSNSVSCLTPTISSVYPNSVTAGSGLTMLTVYGSNFLNGTSAFFNGQARATNVINSNKLTMILTATDVSTAGTGNIRVSNGVNCVSNQITFTINSYSSGGSWWNFAGGGGWGNSTNNGGNWWWNPTYTYPYRNNVIPPPAPSQKSTATGTNTVSQNQATNNAPAPSISDLINQQKTNFSSSILNWLIIVVLIILVALIIARVRGKQKEK